MKFFLFIAFVLSGCANFVPLDEVPSSKATPQPLGYRDIAGVDAGSGLPFTSLHFVVEGYGAMPIDKSQTLEKIFTTVMDKTALYSFKPKENYRAVIYRTQEEYRAKTGQPEWSGGMKLGRGVFTFEQYDVDSVLAHEITHIIFGEFMEGQEQKYRWLNEGLAMYIEAHFEPGKQVNDIQAAWVSRMREVPILTLDEILRFKPYSEKARDVELWYATVADFTAFLIQNGGAFNFSLFLKQLREGGSVDQALTQAYPGKYRSMEELYAVWRGTL